MEIIDSTPFGVPTSNLVHYEQWIPVYTTSWDTGQFVDPWLTHIRSDQLLNGVYILPDWNLIPFLPFALGQFKQTSFCMSLVIAAVCSHFPHGFCQMTCKRSVYLPDNFSQGGLIIPVSQYTQRQRQTSFPSSAWEQQDQRPSPKRFSQVLSLMTGCDIMWEG